MCLCVCALCSPERPLGLVLNMCVAPVQLKAYNLCLDALITKLKCAVSSSLKGLSKRSV